ncbi:hypothetical protein [Bacillus sp. NPDC094077]|uniref:hypothetical protein n=1 Tax=Bacillus sp. NPDC094077 TaxID=3390932 RepID=UPI003D04FF3B
MKEFIPNIITGVCTLIGALGGVYWTQKGNKNILEQQVTRDMIKEKRNELKETLSTYSQILKIDGETQLYIKVESTIIDFDLDFYKSKIRPILFEKYHILHDDVALSVKRIDDVIKKCNYTQKIERDDHILLNRNYSLLVSNMRQHIYNFRKEDIS